MPMQKAPVPFGEWRPDIALLDNKFASEALNVFAGFNSYKPFPGLVGITTDTLPAEAVGLTSARDTAGTWHIFAGTRTKLYKWSLAGWVDVTRTVGGDYSVAEEHLWQFEQSGPWLIAVNLGDEPQRFNLDSGTAFENLPGSPPNARHVRQIGDFLVLSGLLINERMIQWSAINDITGWTVGTNLSDIQEFPDCGPVQGVAGGEIGYVVQDRGIRLMQFLPGDTTLIFSFSRVLWNKGCISKYGFITVGNILYFLAEDGFYAMSGSQLQPIGEDKVNAWFRTHSDQERWGSIQALTSQRQTIVAWAFHTSSASQNYDHLLLFNVTYSYWSHCYGEALGGQGGVSAQVWATLASPGLDLDTDGPEPGDVGLDSTAHGLDSFAYLGGRPLIGAIDPNGILSSLNGPNMPAIMETVEDHLVPGQRAFVSDAYPLIDTATNTTVTAGTRERLQDPVVWGNAIDLEITGSCALYSSSRLHRFRVATQPAAVWTDSLGVLVEVQQDGTVA